MQDKRKKRKRVDKEANFIADIFRLLFALSVAGVTIVAGFLLFKNIYGFSLPNLKERKQLLLRRKVRKRRKLRPKSRSQKRKNPRKQSQ